MDITTKIKTQQDEINTLKAALVTAEKRCEQYAQAYDQMHQQLQNLLRHRFGKKSERFIDPEHP